jgi:hypothetical protein
LINNIKQEDKFLANNSISFADCNTPAFFTMLKEFEIHFNKVILKPDGIKDYEKTIENQENLSREYKRYGFEIRTWIANKLLA